MTIRPSIFFTMDCWDITAKTKGIAYHTILNEMKNILNCLEDKIEEIVRKTMLPLQGAINNYYSKNIKDVI